MGCYHPLKGYLRQDKHGKKFTMSSPRSGAEYTPQTVACGQCVGCRLDRSRTWAIRCMHEASLYSENCFITLTYSPEHLPDNGSLDYDHFQKFMKRLRFSNIGIDTIVDDNGAEQRPIRFYMAGEYGGERGRPHFHACIFNFDFKDKKPWKRSPSGEILYRSAELEELWPYGFSSVGSVNFKSAAYVARYIMKKVTGNAAAAAYETVDADGVVDYRVPEFNKMSLKPGIGARWFDKYSSDVFPHDYVVVNGKKCKPPRYYDNLYLKQTGFYFEHFDKIVSSAVDEIAFARHELALLNRLDNTPERLKVKETIAYAKLSKLKRTLI